MDINIFYLFFYLTHLPPSINAYFNVEQFLNITDDSGHSYSPINMYYRFHMCWPSQGSKEIPERSRGACCFCRPSCMKTKRCCINAFWNSSYASRQEDYIRHLLDSSRQYKDQECSTLLPKHIIQGDGNKYYMITSCQQSSATKELREKCMMGNTNGNSIEYYIPVKGNDDYLYRNKYCAMCNSVSEFGMVPIEKVCYTGRVCDIQLVNTNETFTTCNYNAKEINKSCARENKFYDLCRAFSGPMGNYANYFCHLCNHGYPSNPIYPSECTGGSTGVPPLSWGLLLKLDFSDKEDSQCKGDNVLDGTTQKCTSYVCPAGYQARNSKCVVIKSESSSKRNVKNASFDKCLHDGYPNIFLDNIPDYSKLLKELFTAQKIHNKHVSMVGVGNMKIIDGSSIQNISTQYNENKITNMLKQNQSVIFSAANSIFYNNKLRLSQFFSNNLICADPILIDPASLNFTRSCDATVDAEIIPYSNLSLQIVIDKNGLKRNAYSCKSFHLSKPCPRQVLHTNFTSTINTTLVYAKDGTGRVFKLHEYAPYNDGGFTVCIESKKNQLSLPWLSTVDSVTGYLSIVGSSLSVLCYMLLIATILQFKELQNVPGLCTLALSINLLIGDALFLTTNFMYMSALYGHMTTLCDVIGILIHFFLLSAQMWGLVMAIDISANLIKMTFKSQNSKLKFIGYNFIPILFAAVLVTLALVFRANDILDVSYNKAGMCVLHGFYSRIFFYFLPLLICFAVSISSLTYSMGHIVKEKRKSKAVLEGGTQNSTSMVQVGLKLVILCGLTEGIGIINIPTKPNSPEKLFIVNSIFMMLYSLVKGFRGVMLFLVYACRKPVYKMYRRRYGKKGIKQNDLTFNSMATTRI